MTTTGKAIVDSVLAGSVHRFPKGGRRGTRKRSVGGYELDEDGVSIKEMRRRASKPIKQWVKLPSKQSPSQKAAGITIEHQEGMLYNPIRVKLVKRVFEEDYYHDEAKTKLAYKAGTYYEATIELFSGLRSSSGDLGSESAAKKWVERTLNGMESASYLRA